LAPPVPLPLPLLLIALLLALLPVPPPHAFGAPPSMNFEASAQPKFTPAANAERSTTLPQTMSGRQQPGKLIICPIAAIA
jgi:hypothetical protein